MIVKPYLVKEVREAGIPVQELLRKTTMIDNRHTIIERIFASQNESGLWQLIPEIHKYYPDCLHYTPNYKASLRTLILLAELQGKRDDYRVSKQEVKNHLFDEEHGI